MTAPITTNDNGGTHAVAFSPDGRLMAISSLHFDVDKANDAGTGAISLAHVASGVVQWRRTFPGLAKPVAFYAEGPSVVGLHGDASMRFRDAKTGELLMMLSHSADSPREDGGTISRPRNEATCWRSAEWMTSEKGASKFWAVLPIPPP